MSSEITRLDREMRQVLAEMTILSYGRASNWDPKSDGGKPGAVMLHRRQIGIVLHEYWAEVYADQRSDEAREETIAAARKELQNELVQRERPSGETDKEMRRRCVQDCRGMNASEAAVHMRKTTTWVIQARKLACMDPSRGLPIVEADDWRETAHDLWARGLSLREIAQRVGRSHEGVRQALRRAA